MSPSLDVTVFHLKMPQTNLRAAFRFKIPFDLAKTLKSDAIIEESNSLANNMKRKQKWHTPMALILLENNHFTILFIPT